MPVRQTRPRMICMLSSNTQVLIAFLVRRGSLAATHHQRGRSPKHISRRRLCSSRTPTVPASTSSNKQCSRTSKRVSLNLTQSSGATYRKYCSRKSANPFGSCSNMCSSIDDLPLKLKRPPGRASLSYGRSPHLTPPGFALPGPS